MPTDAAPRLPAADRLAVAAALTAYLAAFWPAWRQLVATWSGGEEYSHGFLIVPVALWLLWRRRLELRGTPQRPSPLGLVLILFALAIYLVSFLAGVWTLCYLCLVAVPAGAVLFLYGGRVLGKCLFPLFLLLFMIPVPAQLATALTAPLQIFVSQATVFLVKLGGIPILREGNILHLPGGSFQVVQACSGLRSLFSLLTLSVLFAYLTLRNNRLRTLLFFAGLPVAIAVNILRVLLMLLAFHFFAFDLVAGPGHQLFGLGIFLLAVFLLLGFRSLLTRWDDTTAAG